MFVTVYTRKIKRRATGLVQQVGLMYRTKSLTPMHAYIRSICPDAQTWERPAKVITDFVPGMNLGTLPIVVGGRRVDA